MEPLPIFERRLWSRAESDASMLPYMRHLTEPCSQEQSTHEHINIHFSGEQLAELRALIGRDPFTIQDAMTAYIIVTLNTHCCMDDQQLIRHTNIIINYRGVSDDIAPPGLMANCTIRMLSEHFHDPYSLSSIATAIRHSVIRSRNTSFLCSMLSTAGGLMRDLARNRQEVNVDHFPHGIIINSNYRYDWADLVDLGYTDQCRFYTDGTAPLFLHVFRLNPVFDGSQWSARDRHGAEVAFQIDKRIKQTFMNAWQHDLRTHFSQLKC